MEKRPLGRSGIEINPLVLGGNVFGWTIDEAKSFEVLDAFVDAGMNAVDTADVYSRWVPGNTGGESETILGNWFKRDPSKRDRVVLMTKVGADMGDGRKGLSAKWIEQSVEDSLRRLRTDRIDLYQSHWPDDATPYEETLGAYDKLLKAGKVRAIGASNFSVEQFEGARRTAGDKGLPPYEVLQSEYNLYDRAGFEAGLREAAIREGIGVITYFSLASGFLSGKYRSKDDLGQSQRGSGVAKYLDDRGMRILAAIDEVAARLNAKPAEVALAWLVAREGITAPIASATSTSQVESLRKAVDLTLSGDDIRRLDTASAA